MNFIKKYKNKIIAAAIISLILVISFLWGGDAPGLRSFKLSRDETGANITESAKEENAKQTTKETEDVNETKKDDKEQNAENTKHTEDGRQAEKEKETNQKDIVHPNNKASEPGSGTEKDKYKANSVPEENTVAVEYGDEATSGKEHTCTLSVRCDTILKNLDWLSPEKRELVPEDGVIYKERTVTFYEGENVFELLTRELKRNKIHMEFKNTPIYNSAYIEGINNIYEFDCGELSGWMYRVNGIFPNYGCSGYLLKDGDRVEWVYTCDLGADVGGGYSKENGK